MDVPSAGAVAVICVVELITAVAGWPVPKSTTVFPATKPVPAMVTDVPPDVPPPTGTTPVTVGTLS